MKSQRADLQISFLFFFSWSNVCSSCCGRDSVHVLACVMSWGSAEGSCFGRQSNPGGGKDPGCVPGLGSESCTGRANRPTGTAGGKPLTCYPDKCGCNGRAGQEQPACSHCWEVLCWCGKTQTSFCQWACHPVRRLWLGFCSSVGLGLRTAAEPFLGVVACEWVIRMQHLALAFLGLVLQMWHRAPWGMEAWVLLPARGCQGPQVTTKMSLLFLELEQDQEVACDKVPPCQTASNANKSIPGLTYGAHIWVSVLRSLLQSIGDTPVRKCSKTNAHSLVSSVLVW